MEVFFIIVGNSERFGGFLNTFSKKQRLFLAM
jgi:hypothetical protein